jgi:D-serine deaminase-like pyridoxal phosphate-dependent protein
MTEDHLPTPALVIDLPTAERNIAAMARYCRDHNLNLRPHTKTHKLRMISRLQMNHGAVGLTCAKVGELQVMSDVCDDLLLAYPAVDDSRCRRLAELAHSKTIRVAVDTPHSADALAEAARRVGSTIGILVDLDIGFHRTGVQTPGQAVSLAQHISRQKNLRLDGLFCFPGHVNQYPEQQGEHLAQVAQILQSALDAFDRHGLNRSIVSGGNSPSALHSHLVPQYTEIRPGTYVYHDWNQAYARYCAIDDCAARFLCTVVSDAVPDKIVLDAGSKTLSSDRLGKDPTNGGFGHLVEYPHAKITRLSEEHAEVDLSACDTRPRVGDRLHLIPNHICVAVNLQNTAWLRHSDGALEQVPIDARGLLS